MRNQFFYFKIFLHVLLQAHSVKSMKNNTFLYYSTRILFKMEYLKAQFYLLHIFRLAFIFLDLEFVCRVSYINLQHPVLTLCIR